MRHVAETRRRRIASGWTGRGAGALPDRALPGSASRSHRGARDRAAWGVAPSRVAGRPAWRYPACRARLSIRVARRAAAAALSRQDENVAFGLSQQCGSGCPLRHRIAHYNLPSEPCGCAPALAASARVHRQGMRLRGSVAEGNCPGRRNALPLARIYRSPLPTTYKFLPVRGPIRRLSGVGAGATGAVSSGSNTCRRFPEIRIPRRRGSSAWTEAKRALRWPGKSREMPGGVTLAFQFCGTNWGMTFCKILFLLVYWRRGRDSNPRWGLTHTPLAGERLQPLGHLSRWGRALVAQGPWVSGAPSRIRTCNPRLRRPMPYPVWPSELAGGEV